MHQNISRSVSATEDLLTEREAAQLRRQSIRTLQAERLRGTGGCTYVKLGRSVRYRRVDVKAFIEANLHQAVEPVGAK